MPEPTPEQLQKELAYYRRRLDESAAEALKYEYTLADVQHQLRQKRQGYSLLSELALTSSGKVDREALFARALEGIGATLQMDRGVTLVPTAPGRFQITASLGYSTEEAQSLVGVEIEFPEEVSAGRAGVLLHKKTEMTPWLERAREGLKVPFFVGHAVVVEGETVGLILAGRLLESKPRSPPLDSGDEDIFRSLTAFIAGAILNAKVGVMRELDRLKEEFFANISHEFRTPITLTLGPLQSVLSGRHGAVPSAVSEALELASRNQHRLLTLVNEILDLAKLEAGALKLDVAPLRHFNSYLRDVAAVFAPNAEQKGLELKFELDAKGADLDLWGDSARLEKVFVNLLSNAFKFTRQGAVGIATAVGDDDVTVTVWDSGQGIRADQLAGIFVRFKQAEGTSTTDQAGTGIGLALVQEIVLAHHGKLEVESEVGKGTRIHVRLPLGREHFAATPAKEEAATLPEAPRAAASTSASFVTSSDSVEAVDARNQIVAVSPLPSNALVLFVDDNPDLRTYVSGLLEKHYRVLLGVDGQHGLEVARRYPPDLILSDLMMPRMNGAELFAATRQEVSLKQTPFALLTAHRTETSRLEGLNLGVDDYLNKPFSEVELLARVRNLLRVRSQQLRLHQDLRAARGIQQSVLPPAEAGVPGASLSVLYQPCDALSGDFYDYEIRADGVYFYVADVTSHGTAAAQVTYLLKGLFRDALRVAEGVLPRMLMEMAQRYAGYGLEYDVSLRLGHYAPSERMFSFVNGGAPPVILIRDGAARVLPSMPGWPLSRRNAMKPQEPRTERLERGDQLFLFSDGAFEFPTMHGPYGVRRLAKTLSALPATNWRDDLVEKLRAELTGQVFDDDVTVLRLSVDES